MRYALLLVVIKSLLFPCYSFSTNFYVDPVNGSMLNDGSQAHPWSTLQAVWEGNKIETQRFNGQYLPDDSNLITKNAGAPVKAGDTIYLLSGYHGSLTMVSAINSSKITVKALPGNSPTLAFISMTSVRNWEFDGLNISPSYTAVYSPTTTFNLLNHSYTGPSSYVTLKNSYLFGVEDNSIWTTPTEWIDNAPPGIYTQGAYTTIDNVHTKNTAGALVLDESLHSVVRNSLFENIDADGIQLAGASYCTIEDNIVKNIYEVRDRNAWHYDLIQSWATSGTITDVTIARNKLIAWDRADLPFRNTYSVQGMGNFDGWYDNFVIENNIIVAATYHGITLQGANNALIINNTCTTAFGETQACPINVYPHKDHTAGTGSVIRNNICSDIGLTNADGSGGAIQDHNIYTAGANVLLHFVNPSSFDFRLKDYSSAVDTGSTTSAPTDDITSAVRTDGYPDIGAYEHGPERSRGSHIMGK